MAIDYMSMLGLGGNPMMTNNQMMGLLGVDRNQALTRGLLAAAAPLLKAGAGGPNPQDASLGPALAQAGLGGMDAYQKSMQQDMTRGLARMQFGTKLADLQRASQNRKRREEFRKKNPEYADYSDDVIDKVIVEQAKLKFSPSEYGVTKTDSGDVIFFNKKDPNKRVTVPGGGMGSLNTKQILSLENDLRNFYKDNSKPFVTVRDAYTRIQASAVDPSAAGDLALIFNYMKLLDPGSTVREGEFATAQNSAGVPERIRSLFNRAINGERLSEPQRQDFVNRSNTLFASAQKNHLSFKDQVKRIAEARGADPNQIIIDYGSPEVQVQSKTLSGNFGIPTDKAELAKALRQLDELEKTNSPLLKVFGAGYREALINAAKGYQ